jgi:hypothetical protein
MLIIEKNVAAAYKQTMKENHRKEAGDTPTTMETEQGVNTTSIATQGNNLDLQSGESKMKTRFYSSISLDPLTAKVGFNTINDEVIELLTIDPDTHVQIHVEINAENKKGFDEHKQRAVKENCTVLKFRTSEFEE